MLNPALPRNVGKQSEGTYILPDDVAQKVLQQNACLATGPELRVQKIYTYEIWKKLASLGLDKLKWPALKVLDCCCGTGFLSYHLLSVVTPLELTLLDSSENELLEAEKLLLSHSRQEHIKFVRADIMENPFEPGAFDLVIGNSFLHHLYNVPRALAEFRRLLRPGGLFATLHEPTPAAVAYESGCLGLIWDYVRNGSDYIENLRPEGAGNALSYGVDVWLFERGEVKDLFRHAGFEPVLMRDWHLFRPFIVAKLKLHLSEAKPALAWSEETLLRWAVFADSLCNKFLPTRTFSSFSLLAVKPQGIEGEPSLN